MRNIYVTDENTSKVTVMDKDGQFLAKWGDAGSAEGQMRGPSGIAVDGSNDLYIVDSQNHRIQKFSKEGQHLASWGSEGSGPGQVQQALGPVPG